MLIENRIAAARELYIRGQGSAGMQRDGRKRKSRHNRDKSIIRNASKGELFLWHFHPRRPDKQIDAVY